MSADRPQHSQAIQHPEHARDLLARLYREIGISAVAAALQIPVPKADPEMDQRRDVPPMLRKELAA